MRERKRRLWVWGMMVVLLALAAVAVWQRQWIVDFARGVAYQPAGEMGRIRDDLRLTERGEFLFNAAQPKLSEREEFNEKCRAAGESEVAVLGCYTASNIYVYNITETELEGIRELTAAHELLHVAYARLSDAERENLRASLEKVCADNQDVLADDLGTYNEAEQFEELYVRAGTEIKDLPQELEKHYAEYFTNQDKIVAYYEQYIAVFEAVEAEMEALTQEMETMREELDAKQKQYETGTRQLNADIVSFNSCAEVAGCFKNEQEFNDRRAGLVATQEMLEKLYVELSQLISEYNEKVALYNADVTQTQKLNQMINSNEKPQTVK